MTRTRLPFVVALLLSLAIAAPASASLIVGRGTSDVRIQVDSQGRALISFKSGGAEKHVLLWGAINAKDPSPSSPQIAFKVDYSGGWKSLRKVYRKEIKDVCLPYDGPPLPWLVAACKAPDGSYWAAQSWQRMLPNLGIDPWKKSQRDAELHVSHWSGDLPVLEMWVDWIEWGNRVYHRAFGRFTYQGNPVHGFGSTNAGSPTDSYGRNVYLDTLDSAYGAGWKRENSFLTHRPNGNFCYGFYEHDPYPGYPNVGRRPEGFGTRYRATVIGPGVTPLVGWEGDGLPAFDSADPDLVAHEDEMDALNSELAVDDDQCQRT